MTLAAGSKLGHFEILGQIDFGSETTIGAGRRDVYNAHVYTH